MWRERSDRTPSLVPRLGARWHRRCNSEPRVRVANSLIGVVVAHIVLAAGCYDPSLRDCTITCSGSGHCTGDQQCVDGFCAGPNVARCLEQGEAVTVDAAMVTTDADPPVDAENAMQTLCLQGCTKGTCIDGVCTIDCSQTGSCGSDVACPLNLPCHVICGDGACHGKILCSGALSCQVDCTGAFSCDDEIQCPGGRDCDVVCSGASSCKHRTKCSNSCSCDVSCTGTGSCAEASECPATSCRIGNGCTSQLAGCDTCQ
jgi:hypothetical protein